VSRLRILLGAAMLAGVITAVPSPAMAKSGDVVRAGSCTGSADWKLKVGPDNGRWEVEFEVDSNRVGQTWRVKIRSNGVIRYNRLKVTQAPSGSLTARKRVPDTAGSDLIVARARNVASGQRCVARLAI
jgi:hypothetical protein